MEDSLGQRYGAHYSRSSASVAWAQRVDAGQDARLLDFLPPRFGFRFPERPHVAQLSRSAFGSFLAHSFHTGTDPEGRQRVDLTRSRVTSGTVGHGALRP
jgi:hypothetical protein